MINTKPNKICQLLKAMCNNLTNEAFIRKHLTSKDDVQDPLEIHIYKKVRAKAHYKV